MPLRRLDQLNEQTVIALGVDERNHVTASALPRRLVDEPHALGFEFR